MRSVSAGWSRPWTRLWLAALALVLIASLAYVRFFAADGPRSPLFGTLDTQVSTLYAEKEARVSVAMFELSWADFEPRPGVFSSAYVAATTPLLKAYRDAGMRVTLGLGLQDPPSWVFSLPDSSYVDQYGRVAQEANLIFSEPVREAAAGFLKGVAAAFPLSDFWAIRLTSGGDGEVLYPPGGSYWAFDKAALTGAGLPPTMRGDPFPRWRPGEPGLSLAQIDQWVSWYVRGLADVTSWQMRTLSALGFAGYYQLVTPGSGIRPDALQAAERQDLPDGLTGVGAVWDRYYAFLRGGKNVVAYVSSVGDESGGDDSCQPGDDSLPLGSAAMDEWSATRWITRVAAQYHFLVAGENPGFMMPSTLNSHYQDRSSTGMMADAIRQATSCRFQVFYWAHDKDLWNGVIPFSLYAHDIAALAR